MIQITERRSIQRVQVFPVIVNIIQNETKYSGFITDINSFGCKIWLNKELGYKEPFTIILDYPYKVEDFSCTIKGVQKWGQLHPECNAFIMGCQFIDLTGELQSSIQQIISYATHKGLFC